MGNKKNLQAGFSLIEVMLSVSLLCGTAIVISTLQEKQNSQFSTAERKNMANELLQYKLSLWQLLQTSSVMQSKYSAMLADPRMASDFCLVEFYDLNGWLDSKNPNEKLTDCAAFSPSNYFNQSTFENTSYIVETKISSISASAFTFSESSTMKVDGYKGIKQVVVYVYTNIDNVVQFTSGSMYVLSN